MVWKGAWHCRSRSGYKRKAGRKKSPRSFGADASGQSVADHRSSSIKTAVSQRRPQNGRRKVSGSHNGRKKEGLRTTHTHEPPPVRTHHSRERRTALLLKNGGTHALGVYEHLSGENQFFNSEQNSEGHCGIKLIRTAAKSKSPTRCSVRR